MDFYIGTIIAVPYDRVPVNWLPCDGRLLAIKDYEALYVIIGATYGGDARTTFALPDLRGRAPIGADTSQQPLPSDVSSLRLGELKGAYTAQASISDSATFAITSANVPAHTHGVDIPASQLVATSTMRVTKASGVATPVDGAALGTGIKTTAFGEADIYVAKGTPNTPMAAASVTTALEPVSVVSSSAGTGDISVTGQYKATLNLDTMQDSMGINFIICVTGYFPQQP